MAQIVLESGYVPKLRKNPINGLPGIKDGSDVERSVYHILDDIPNHESMLELLLKYDVVGQPTKEELKGAYEECYEGYKDFAKTKEDFLSGKITLTLFSQQVPKRTLGYYKKYCSDKNSTFKDVRSFFAWANETQKQYAIDKVLSSNKNKDNPNKVIYIDQNPTDQVNKNQNHQGVKVSNFNKEKFIEDKLKDYDF